MTRKEAIKQLKSYDAMGIIPAIQMAINALEQPEQRWIPCDWCAYNPPSSMDGKACTICPAVARQEPYREEGGE